MAIQKISAITIVLLSISSAFEESAYNSAFTKEIKLYHGRHPVKVDNELKLFEYDVLISTVPGHENCHLKPFYVSPKSIYNLGNEKLLLVGDTATRYNVIDFKNCSSYYSTLISDDKNDTKSRIDVYNLEPKLASVVTYNDTFDVFDWYQKTCMPCRYNDKGERLQVKYLLEKEPTGMNPEWTHQHEGYSLQLIKDAFGVKNGYFYVFRYVNGTTALRILDSKFKVVKQRLFTAKIEAHSLTGKNLTVCYKRDSCKRHRHSCDYVECHLLDTDLNSIGEVKLHQVSTYSEVYIHVQMRVQNLLDGGAMVAMQFQFNRAQSVHRKDVFLQRIHPNGLVDSPIKFDSVDNDFVFMYDFTFDNGEYCLVTVNDYYSKGSYSLVKCLNPSPADYRKV